MPRLIEQPADIHSGSKLIQEFVGRVNSGDANVSVTRMRAPAGWAEPGQRPDFDEVSVVLAGVLRLEHEDGVIDVKPGQAVVAKGGEWVRYSSASPDGADYLSVCLPAFSEDGVHRD
jgi:quercetin dioxygenase-like cupin family protein